MGIPKYHKWLTERYPGAFAEAQNEKADHVYVDVNALLHDCMRWAANEDDFYQKLFSKFDTLFRTVAPGKSVFLAVDGPASCAKCLTQRQRRRAHSLKDEKSSKKSRGWKGKGKQGAGMSNNMLTPGVPFMARLTSALEYYAASRMKGGAAFGRCESVTVSGAQAVGEGEHKIVSQMLRHASNGAGAESHVIFSGDADIFLLSLVQSACHRVRVVSEREAEPGWNKRGRTMLQIWNAEVLAKCIKKELAAGPATPRGRADEAALRRDFALVSLLAGNDYLPELKQSIAPKQMWEKYLGLRRTKFPKHSLIVAEPAADGLPLSHIGEAWAVTVGEAGAAFNAEPYEHFSFNDSLLIDFMTAVSQSGVQKPSGDKADGAKKYLEGLLWILEMYHHGYCGEFYYVMEKKYHPCAAAPLIAGFAVKAQEDGAEAIVPPRSDASPMRPLTCAMCILPVGDAEKFLSPNAPSLAPMFRTDHALLGSVNAIEKNEELKACKAQLGQLNQEMMSLRNQGLDDSAVRAKLTKAQQRMQGIKEGGSDIDVVPLWDVDSEVYERCSDDGVSTLEFSPDVTLVREAGGNAGTLKGPVRSMPPANCSGISKMTGEWPQANGEVAAGMLQRQEEHEVEDGYVEEIDDDEDEEEQEMEEEPQGNVPSKLAQVLARERAKQRAKQKLQSATPQTGDAIEAYWPDDDTWLPATLSESHADGTFSIVWEEDGCSSQVPNDYVRSAQVDEEEQEDEGEEEVLEPPLKRARGFAVTPGRIM